MDIVGYMNGVNKVGKYLLITVLLLNLFSMSFASASSSIRTALTQLCEASQVFLGGAIMIMVLLAGATYAIGQVLGAETRARATVWATAMLTGAIIGALIYLLTPIIVKALLGASSTILGSGTGPCSF